MRGVNLAMRDDFKAQVLQTLARRSGNRCSNPECRKPTSGPKLNAGSINLGVGAHISAAALGGPRFDATLDTTQRSSDNNGIWLCQTCARLIDTDVDQYTQEKLQQWKQFAEAAASVELLGFQISKGRSFATLEQKIPDLLLEMRSDLKDEPFVREFIALSKKVTYNHGGAKSIFQYFLEDHPDLINKLSMCENYRAISETTYNNTPRFNFSEEFVEYLLG